ILIEDKHNVLIGKTLAVQPFKELSYRDYDRPAKDSKSGMLPPKLAQIMINLSGVSEDEILLDPFCGSGTVLMEGLLMGIKKVIGSDISKKAIDDTKINTDWAIDKFNISNQSYSLTLKSATELSSFLDKKSIDAIVTEPYLGPQRGDHEIRKVKQELEKLYSDTIREFKKVLKPNGRIVMLWPCFVTNRDMRITNSTSRNTELSYLNPDFSGFKIVSPLPKELRNDKIKTTNRNTLIYGREGQRVWREIVTLEHE
ncbi:MAG: DNA methyltransferase, partial [Candidatus Magasanikbacteria bacterium]|nr:DNA methyltransferase [Candidatus Magasanikbacteria bacterium]